MKRISAVIALMMGVLAAIEADAGTGISLTAKDGSRVVARTLDWSSSPVQCGYVVTPRGYLHQSFTPVGKNGLKFKSLYGYVGIYAEYEPFVVEGVNEAGLSAGMFANPDDSDHSQYNMEHSAVALCDMQFVSWVLSQFSSIDQVMDTIDDVEVVTLTNEIGTAHWRIAEPGGRMVVLEFIDGKPCFYADTLGVLTDSPGFEWQMVNLNNYVNLISGSAPDNHLAGRLTLKPFGQGSGMLGLPGDFTSPSRFVRATFLQTAAPVWNTGYETVLQAFHILNSFDVPIGSQVAKDQIPPGLLSATQFTSATDQTALKFYYRTAWNCNIRCIELLSIDFRKVRYQSHPLDALQDQPLEILKVK